MAEQALTIKGQDLPAVNVTTNPAAVYLASLKPTGRRSQAAALRAAAELWGYTYLDEQGNVHGDIEAIEWHKLTYEFVEAIRTKLSETKAPATVNKTLCAIRQTARRAWKSGLMDGETYYKIKDVDGVTGSRLPAGRAASPGELQAIMQTIGHDLTPAGARDAAIFALAYGCGLRRAELAGLELADLSDDGDQVTVTVIGKRDKERAVYLDNGGADAVRDWLAVRGQEPGALFCSGRKGGKLNRCEPITAQAIRDIVAKRAKQADVDHLSPHDLRRSFVSDLLDSGIDIATVANMAGHQSIETTRRYDRRGEVAKQKAARSLHVPYVRRPRLAGV